MADMPRILDILQTVLQRQGAAVILLEEEVVAVANLIAIAKKIVASGKIICDEKQYAAACDPDDMQQLRCALSRKYTLPSARPRVDRIG